MPKDSPHSAPVKRRTVVTSDLTAKETAVVGTLLAECPPDLPPHCARLIEHSPESFDDQRHGTIARAIKQLLARGEPVAPITVQEQLERTGQLDVAGGAMFLDGLTDQAVTIDIAEYESWPLWDAYQLRRTKTALSEAASALEASPAHADSIRATAIRALEQLSSNGENTPQSDPWFSLIEDAAVSVTKELPPVAEIVEGIVAERSKLGIGSSSKSNKTWLAMDLGLSIAHGVPFLGHRTSRRRVLYLNLELKGETFERRIQAIARAKGIAVEPTWFRHIRLRGKLAGASLNSIVTRLTRLAQALDVAVIIIDPTYKLNTEGIENDSRDQTLFFNEIDRLTTDAGCTVIMIDHSGKGNQSEKDPLDVFRGSSVKGGDLDAAMVLRKHEVDGCLRVDLVHRELPPVEPFVIGWNFPLMEPRPGLDPDAMKKPGAGRKPEHDPRKLLAAIAHRTAENPISISAWATAANVKRQTLQSYMPGLRAKGWISTVGEGSSARQCLTQTGQEAVREYANEHH